VVGYREIAPNQLQAFLWDDGGTTALDPLPGDTQSGTGGINGNGKIVGYSQSPSGDGHAVMWSLASDTTPPDVSVSVTPNKLWPPNHQYVTVKATVTATDDTDPNPSIELVSVSSNEPDNGVNDGNTVDDIVIEPASAHSYADTFQLRSERAGLGTGRIYTITYRATDASDNSATKSATVTVPLAK
jgi:probable HAF family extracellular repeat protein